MFYGDNRHGKNPLEFLTNFEIGLSQLPHLSESVKCKRFYNHCKSDFDAGTKILKKNSPAVVTSWPTIVLHFRVKWLGAAPDTLLKIRKPVTTTELDTATMIAYKTSTTTTMNVNTTITTTTTTPAPTSTAALPVYKTTITPARPNHVADTRHVIAPPTLNPAQLKAETTNAPTNSSPSDIRATYTAVRQHGRTEEEPEVERVEMLKEEGKGGKKQGEMSEREVEQRETEAGEQEGIEEAQSKVRDPAASPTTRAAANARLHEPVQSDWAAEVDEAMGLSPTVHDTLQPEPADPAPAPINPAPGDIAVDPDCTAFANAVPANPVAIDPAPVPSNSTPTSFVHPVPADSTTTDSSPVTCVNMTDITPTEPMHVDPVAETFVTRPIHQALALLSSIFYFIFMLESERARCRVLDRERGHSLFRGGALVVVSYAHSSGVRGPAEGFRVFAVLFRLFVSS
jgi:hypothetical protein